MPDHNQELRRPVFTQGADAYSFGGSAGAAAAPGFADAQAGFHGGSFGARMARMGQTGAMNRLSLFTGEPIGPYVPGKTPPGMPVPAKGNGDGDLSYNERVKRVYATYLAHEGQSEIFKDTEFWN